MQLRQQFDEEIDKMTIDDMPNHDMSFVATQCGIEFARTLLKKMAGSYIMIPRKKAFGKVMRKFVIAKFDGHNARELAWACQVHIATIYRIINSEDIRRTASRFEQLSLFSQGNAPEERLAANG